MGGIRYTTGDADGLPARVGVSLGDSLASLHGVIGALMSLLRVKTGQGDGQVVDVSLVESVFNLMESLVPEYDLLGHVRERSGGALPGIAPSNTYRTEDGGFVVIAGNSDPIYKRLMHVIGRPDLADDPALAHNDGRALQSAMLDEAITAWTSHHSHRRRAGRRSNARKCRRGASIRWPTSSPIRTTRRATCCCRREPAGRRIGEDAGHRAEALRHAGRSALARADARRAHRATCWPRSASTRTTSSACAREGAVQ